MEEIKVGTILKKKCSKFVVTGFWSTPIGWVFVDLERIDPCCQQHRFRSVRKEKLLDKFEIEKELNQQNPCI